jgi:ATP-dependent DNA helicase RecQ
MVSARHPQLVPLFARRLAAALGLRYVEALQPIRQTEQQKGMQNNSYRAKNLDGSLQVVPFDGMQNPGLLVDDMYDSGMTVTVAAALLRGAGAGITYPFTLSKASGSE